MKREWNKACKKLAEAAGDRASNLKAEQWVSGMGSEDYTNLHYTAYIEDIGVSDMKPTPMEAVIDIIQHLQNKC